jgi:hypothetical protein
VLLLSFETSLLSTASPRIGVASRRDKRVPPEGTEARKWAGVATKGSAG